MIVPNKLGVYVGENTGEKSAAFVARMVLSSRVVTAGANVELFTRPEVIRDRRAAAAATAGGVAAAHSAGCLIAEDMLELDQEELPAAFIGFAPPEPAYIPRLIEGALKRVEVHGEKARRGGPSAVEHWQIVEDTDQAIIHPVANLGHINEIAEFSGQRSLGALAARGVMVVAIVCGKNDEFGYGELITDPGVTCGVYYDSCHDRVLTEKDTMQIVTDLGVLPQLPPGR